MRLLVHPACLVLVGISLLAQAPAAEHPAGGAFPDPAVFMREVRAATQLDYELQSSFTYVEERRDVRISKLGKVEVGPLRRFEVYPSRVPGRTYKRLVAIDGNPLPPDELARRDREREKDEAELRRRLEKETPSQRASRLREEAAALAERNAILDDALAIFDGRFEATEMIDGEAVYRLAISPRPAARVRTREGRWLKEFGGRVWISAAERQIVKLDMEAIDDVSIGWGILGRVHRGSRFVFTRRRFDGAWLPAEVIFDATGRTLLFRRFDLDVVTTYSGYRRVATR